MILENLRDRMPLSFSQKPVRKRNPRADHGRAVAKEKNMRRALLGWRLLYDLAFRDHVRSAIEQAAREEAQRVQLASDGGVEVGA